MQNLDKFNEDYTHTSYKLKYIEWTREHIKLENIDKYKCLQNPYKVSK